MPKKLKHNPTSAADIMRGVKEELYDPSNQCKIAAQSFDPEGTGRRVSKGGCGCSSFPPFQITVRFPAIRR